MTDSRELMLERALKRYMAAVSALATKSTSEPSRNLFDERPMSEAGVKAWLELNEAGKYAASALAKECDICKGTGSADYAHFAMDPCPLCTARHRTEAVKPLVEALELAQHVRKMTRAENAHARGIQHQHKHGLEDAPTSRDDVDMIHADLYAAWPAKRLDALIAALRSVQS